MSDVEVTCSEPPSTPNWSSMRGTNSSTPVTRAPSPLQGYSQCGMQQALPWIETHLEGLDLHTCVIPSWWGRGGCRGVVREDSPPPVHPKDRSILPQH
ncbi:hypothetical protein J6590_027429 [Homalodisca vitripennis]|nr:hypothetical protein J6590_027429 [Homalodisca vitripennis]